MNFVKEWSGVVAVVILAIIGLGNLFSGSVSLGTACTGITCLSGGLRLTDGPLEVDSGSETLTSGSLTLTSGNLTLTSGNASIGGTLAVTGQSTLTATSTLSDTVNFNNPGICINFYATSTATRLHLVASTTSAGALSPGSAAVMVAEYGACAL